MKLTALFLEFFNYERISGVILILSAVAALLVANSPFGKNFLDFWHIKVGFNLGFIH
jgi:NhaA family Na+:H+ antiporter